jgi:hypothetical protein
VRTRRVRFSNPPRARKSGGKRAAVQTLRDIWKAKMKSRASSTPAFARKKTFQTQDGPKKIAGGMTFRGILIP